MLSLKNAAVVKNGFKDVFGSDTPRRYSIDSVHNSKRYRERSVDVDVPVRNSVSCHDVCDDSFADFSREISPNDGSSIRKVLPKVGNKKSDKILGENLSDLSIDHASIKGDQDPIEQFVEENVAEKKIVAADQKSATHNNQSDEPALSKEKAAMLMNILDRYSQEQDYSNKEPVVEEIIVPRKKKTGHICDEDEFEKHFHSHEKPENDKLREDVKPEDLEVLIVTPKKPQRDMSIYRRSLENLNDTAAPIVVAPVRRKKSMSREDLPSPPPRPTRSAIVDEKSQENVLSMSPTKELTLQPPLLQLNLSSEKVKLEDNSKTITTPPSSPVVRPRIHQEKKEPVTESVLNVESAAPGQIQPEINAEETRSHGKKHQGTGLTFSSDTLSKMKQRVLEFQMSQEYEIEDISNENDGSNNVTPSKTLDPITKKISVSSMQSLVTPESPSSESQIEDPIKVTASTPKDSSTVDNISELESLSASDTLSNDGSGGSSKTIVQCVVQKKIEDKKDITVLPAEESLFNQSSILLAEKSVENILTSDVNMQVLSNVLNEMYDKTVLDEFQNYLETEGTDIGDDRKLPGDHSDGLIKDLKLKRAEKSSVPTSPVIEVVELPEPTKSPRLENQKKKKKKRTKKQPVPEEDQVSIESISDDGYSNLVKTASKDDITNNALLAVSAQSRPRRESICDVDNWFNNHIDPAPSTLNVDNLRDMRMMRRGSDFMVGYDTGSTFPFGRVRHDSESSEFFEKNTFSKSSDNLKDSNLSLNKGSNGSLNLGSNGSLNKDHSSLLRFVVPAKSPLAMESSPPNKTIEDIKNDRNKHSGLKQVTIVAPSIEIVVTPEEDDNKGPGGEEQMSKV